MLGNLVYNRDPAERRIPLTPILPQFVRRANGNPEFGVAQFRQRL